jgi:hypothetical protein
MQGEEVLMTIVDLALGLIGLSSIVTALRRSREKSWSVPEINGLVFLAVMAVGAIIFSLLPFPLFYMEMSDRQAFAIAAAVYCLFGFAVVLGFAYRARTRGFPSRRPWVFNLFAILSVAVIIMMGLLALGVISEGIVGFYLFGVMWMLVLALVQFLTFLSFVGFLQEEQPAANA